MPKDGVSIETAERIADAWKTAATLEEAMQMAGLQTKDKRTLFRRRRQAEELLGVTFPPLGQAYNSSWMQKPDVPQQYLLDHPYTVVIFSDAHFWPGATSDAYWILLQVLEELGPDLVIDNGDSWDGASISRHDPNLWEHKPSLRQELDCVREHLGSIQEYAGADCDFIKIIGNHDMRWEAMLASKAPYIQDMPSTKVSDLFPDWEHQVSVMLNGHTWVKHRWHSGVHGAWNNVLKAGVSMITGHTHRLGIRPYTDMRGTRYGIETGTLARPWGPQFRYVEQNPRNWQMGFVVLTIDGDTVHPEVVEVKDGIAWFRGRKWHA